MFPAWEAVLVTRRDRWNREKATTSQKEPSCAEVFDDFAALYQTRHGQPLRVLDVNAGEYEALKVLDKTGGKETDHSRGHWPVEAYAHLVVGPKLLDLYRRRAGDPPTTGSLRRGYFAEMSRGGAAADRKSVV